jgi:phosphate starvation-inducible PhoH-like protein
MRVYVLDASVAVDYPDIIPNRKETSIFRSASIDLTSAHIVIPELTVIQLSLLKEKGGYTGQAASEALTRIRNLFSTTVGRDVSVNGQTFSVQKFNSKECINAPYVMGENDINGLMIASTLKINESSNSIKKEVTLLTNDNGLASRATMYGLSTPKYFRDPYTGRRDVVVPEELYNRFWSSERGIPVEDWRDYMPSESELIANEFIVMYANGINSKLKAASNWKREQFNYIGRYDVDTQSIVKLKSTAVYSIESLTTGQAIYAEALMNPAFSAVICTGPAGTGKTYLAAAYAIESCSAGKYLGGVVVPCSPRRNTLGALPGNLAQKLDPNVQPIKNAIRNLLVETKDEYKTELQNLHKYGPNQKKGNGDSNTSLLKRIEDDVEGKFRRTFNEPVPIEFAKGRDFARCVVICDEFQDQDFTETDTLIKRIGKEGKMIITGDVKQVHARDKGLNEMHNGIVFAKNACMNLDKVAVVDLYADEIVRSSLVREVVKRQEGSASKIELVG